MKMFRGRKNLKMTFKKVDFVLNLRYMLFFFVQNILVFVKRGGFSWYRVENFEVVK